MKAAQSGIQRIDGYVHAGEAGDRTPRAEIEETVTGLFDEYRVGLLRYMSSFGLPMPDAEEVVQEVFLALFDHLERGRPRQNLAGWLFRVAHNQGLKRREGNRRQRTIASAHPGATPAPAAPATPEEEIHANERRRNLVAAIERLPEIDRQCLFLRAEGFRYRQIAEITGLSLGGVALALKRALGILAEKDGG
jgi:RNA polymerase sigma-70 factor (ECF subfamily)